MWKPTVSVDTAAQHHMRHCATDQKKWRLVWPVDGFASAAHMRRFKIRDLSRGSVSDTTRMHRRVQVSHHSKNVSFPMQRGRRASLPRGSTIPSEIVEYHPSMSLEGPVAALDFLSSPRAASSAFPPPPSTAAPSLAPPLASLASVLHTRHATWTCVDALIDSLSSTHESVYSHELEALRRLQQLHFLCNILPTGLCIQRETHLRTLQLAALQQLKKRHVNPTPSE